MQKSQKKEAMVSDQERQELNAKARQGETVVPGGTVGKSLQAQEHLSEGRSRGGQTRKEQLGHEGYQEIGQRGGQTRKDHQLGHELDSKERQRQEVDAKERQELDAKAKHGETVVPGGTGGMSLEAQEHLADGRSRGGQTRKDQLGHEGYQEMGQRGGQTRKDQLSHEGYREMGRKGGLSTMEKSSAERVAEEGIDIDESKFRTRT
ncbi:hypothetical protein LWI28_010139 [Acer negundo]|uniref:Uncharacterized protein n=1 Tax=Acer negundo TaxID=4023 RepID=A0AAD5NDT7_ACENE|nr:hypothetical protein LWI28_010139 [Acer negundo]